MTDSDPTIYFLHYWGKGKASTLAAGFRAALDQTGKQPSHAQVTPIRPIVFVCEHGAAKSVIAAANFNKLAAEQNLPWRAVARGVHPDDAIPANIQGVLTAEGMNVSEWKPQAVGVSDVRGAERVITLSCDLPASAAVKDVTPEAWTVPQITDGYPAARTAIVQRVQELLTSLASAGGQ
jgi:protein-tyrosine-phosphatase